MTIVRLCVAILAGFSAAAGTGLAYSAPAVAPAPDATPQDGCSSAVILGKDQGLPDDGPPPAASAKARQALAARYERRARLFAACQNFRAAAHEYGLARSLTPDDLDDIAGIADARLGLRDYENAVSAYSDLISRSQYGPPFGGLRMAYANRASALLGLDRREDAVADLTQAIEKLDGPLPNGVTLASLKSQRARADLNLGRYAQAEAEYKALIDGGLFTAGDLYGLGVARLRANNPDGAVSILLRAEQKLDIPSMGEDIHGERLAIDLALAQAYQARAAGDDPRNARDLYERVLAQDPANRDAAAGLAALPVPPPRPSFEEPRWAALALPDGVADPQKDLPATFCSAAQRNAYLDTISALSAVVNDDITLAGRYSASLLERRRAYDETPLLRYSEKIEYLSLFDAELGRLLAIHKALAQRGDALLGLFGRVRDDPNLVGQCSGEGAVGAAAAGAGVSPLELAGLRPLEPSPAQSPPATQPAPSPPPAAAPASLGQAAAPPAPSLQTAETTAAAAPPPVVPSATATPEASIYAVESQINFNVLDSVFFDPSTGDLALVGHHDDRFKGEPIPYLQYLATLLESPKPEFSLEWTPDSLARVDAMLQRELTQSESDAQAARLAAMVDNSSGLVTHTGALMLPALGIHPIDDDRAPGDLGVDVETGPDASVLVSKVAPGSAADKAGLKPMDQIVSLRPGQPAYFDAEFRRQVRFAGAGAAVQLSYLRDGQSQTTSATLDTAPDSDPWQGVDRYDLMAFMYRGAGDQDAANVVEAMGVLNTVVTGSIASAAPRAAADLMHALGVDAEFHRVQAAAANGAPPYQDSYDMGLKVSQQLDAIFHFAGAPLQTLYESKVGQTHDPGGAVSAVFGEFSNQLTPKVGELMDHLLYRPGVGFQIPPELVEDEYKIHPQMTPKYIGVPADSQLARLMLDGDYLGKQLTNRQDLRDRIPGYETQIEYQITHPDAGLKASSAWRVWLSLEGVDAAQSSDGRTLALKGARMRYNIRQTDDQAIDLPGQPPNGYETVLTGLYDAFEQRFATLHGVREAAKLTAVAQWMRSRSPDVRLPADGRTAWRGPDQVDGLVYIYLTTDQQHQAKIIKIAEGGLSLVPPAGSPAALYPVDSSVVDLRTAPAGAAAFTPPAGAKSPASWVATLSGDASGRQAVVVQTGLFGQHLAPPLPALGEAPARPVTVHSASEQLASIAQSGLEAKGVVPGQASAPPPNAPRTPEGASERAGCGFDTSTCAAAVNAPPPPTPPQTRALMERVGPAANDPVIQNSIAWYRKLELRQSDTQRKIDEVQARLDKNDGDPTVLIAQKATLQNELSQNSGDQAAVLAQVKARMDDLRVPWTEEPAPPPAQPSAAPAAPADGSPPGPSPQKGAP